MQRYRSNFKPRSVKRLEKKAKKNLVLTIIILAIAAYGLIFWIFPAVIGSLTFLDKFKPTTKVDNTIEDRAIAPPNLIIPFESTNSGELQIKGFAEANSEVEIYIDEELKTTTEADSSGSFETNSITLNLGTNNITGRTINNDGKKSLSSKNIRLYYSDEKPKLDISEPGDDSKITGGDKKIRVSGKTDPENNVTVNGSSVILNGEGAFTTEVGLNDGDNIITIIATNEVGSTSKVERKVNYTPQ